ncbi:MAG: hypothetical protein ABIS92_06455 [Polyangia bacterium]
MDSGPGGFVKYSAPYARIAGTLAVLAVTQFPAVVRADGFTKDQLGTVAKPADDQNRSRWIRKMAGSSLELSSYVGSGTFYASGYHDSYVSTAVYARPTFDLGTRFQLSLNGRLYVEEELTKSAAPNGRGFNPYDIWLWLSAKELHRFQTSKIRLGGTLRLVIPISYESRYAHMVTGLAGGLSLTRTFPIGNDPTPERNWNLTLALASIFTKYVYSSELRGSHPGDTSGCRPFQGNGVGTAGSVSPSASESDRCGGPVNTNYSFTSSGTVVLGKGKWSLAVILLVANAFHYRVDPNIEAMLDSSAIGRSDSTWGIVSLGYSFTDHFGASLGLSSFQPALDGRYQHLRFPFFDSSGTNANNYTQAFVSLSGTL